MGNLQRFFGHGIHKVTFHDVFQHGFVFLWSHVSHCTASHRNVLDVDFRLVYLVLVSASRSSGSLQ